jgi:DNA polymerase-3 subunit delta
MNLNKRAEAERFLSAPPAHIRAAVIYGRDRGGVRERAHGLAAKLVKDPDDPFDVGVLTEADLDSDPARLADELSALSLTGGRRLVRLQLGEKAGPDRLAAEALKAHEEGAYNADAFLLIEAGALGRDSALRKAAEAAKTAACLPVYEDELGDLARLTREALHKDGVGLTSDALDLFVARLPRERGVARQEIERLSLFLGPRSGTVGDPSCWTRTSEPSRRRPCRTRRNTPSAAARGRLHWPAPGHGPGRGGRGRRARGRHAPGAPAQDRRAGEGREPAAVGRKGRRRVLEG